MIRYLIALACCLLTTPAFSNDEEAKEEFFLSTPEQVATLSSEPSYLVGGLISPLSGQPVLRQTDLVVNGAQSIVLSRTYIPPHMPCSFGKNKHNQEECICSVGLARPTEQMQKFLGEYSAAC